MSYLAVLLLLRVRSCQFDMSLSGRVERSAWAKVQDVSMGPTPTSAATRLQAFLVHDLYKIMMKLVQSAFMPHLESEFTSCLWYCACAFCDRRKLRHQLSRRLKRVYGIANVKTAGILLRYRTDWLLPFCRPCQVKHTYRNAKGKRCF